MRRAAPVALLLAVLLAGCAIPRWMPLIGKKDSEKEEPGKLRREAAERRKAAAERKRVTEGSDEPKKPPIDESVVDRVVAVVNNDAITWGELLQSVLAYRQDSNQAAPASDEDLARQVLTRLIDGRLQLQEAEREKIVVEDQEVTEELQDRLKKLGGKTQEELEAVLKTQGMTIDSVKQRIRDGLRTAKVQRRKVGMRVSVTEPEVDRYFAENRQKLETGLAYHARHILILPEGDTEAAWQAARVSAEARHRELLAGADFAELARQYSGDSSARDGGDLGSLKRGELSGEVEQQILSLAPGQISAPYRSSLGYHIFRLESKEDLTGDALTRVRQQIRDILFREKYEARLDAWLKEIKGRAVIEVRL
jgi:peptidyl-prolyl cis-trans isomerase SurA